jgi:hypothetical protein
MSRDAWKTMAWLLPELLGLVVLLHYSLKWSIFYVVCLLLFVSYAQMHYLRKLIRTFQVVNENRILAIMERLRISDADVKDVARRGMSSLTEEQLRNLDQDFRDLGL